MKADQHFNRRWWIADPGIGNAGLIAGRHPRSLRRLMRELNPGAKIRYYLHLNPRVSYRSLTGK